MVRRGMMKGTKEPLFFITLTIFFNVRRCGNWGVFWMSQIHFWSDTHFLGLVLLYVS